MSTKGGGDHQALVCFELAGTIANLIASEPQNLQRYRHNPFIHEKPNTWPKFL